MNYTIDPIAEKALNFILPICEKHGLKFSESLALPLMGEAERIENLWKSLMIASEKKGSRQLFVAFINEHEIEDKQITDSNFRTLDFFSVPKDFDFSLNPLGAAYLLLINGTRDNFKLKKNEGVGRARKVPADLCWGLWKAGVLSSDLHRQTDADVLVPLNYFETSLDPSLVAGTYPYRHSQGELSESDYKNLLLYEQWLASYCEGLEYAGSPYSYWALGSTLMFRLNAYEKIRGFPNVQAGEDFHFLAKLRKVGQVKKLLEPILEIRGRHSLRVPFGTGRALENMSLGTKDYAPYPKVIFEDLKSVILQINFLSEHQNLQRFFESLDQYSSDFFKSFEKSFANILSQGSSAEKKLKLLHENFDALATLRWVNGRLKRQSIKGDS